MGAISPLRVLLTADAIGGVWDYALTLAGGLLQLGRAEVLLAVLGPPPDATRLRAARAIEKLAVVTLGGRLDWMEGGRESAPALRSAIARLAARWRADVVHVNGQFSLAGLADEQPLASEGRRPPIVFVAHSDVTTWWRWTKDDGAEQSTLPDYLNWHRGLARDALVRADAVVCPTAFLADELARLYCPERRAAVIYNAVAAPAPIDQRCGRERDLAVVAGRVWDEAKNVGLVAAALPRCVQPCRVEVAGDLAEPGKVPAPPPSAPGMTYRGYLPKDALASLFHRAAVYIAASRYEPFGQTPAEAALAGCAVLANDIPVFREIWGDAAAYFARNDPQALAAALDDLYEDPNRRSELAATGKQRVIERYTVDRMVGAYLGLYRRLLCLPAPLSHVWRG